ncbi:unnamed protein product [Ectocarpus sp. CCAP 1310/34]|nr:unnamed protein product [Ectocarpus sp. CCAP 1310/34]
MKGPFFFRESKHLSVLVIGLDNAGKTSVLCHLANVASTNRSMLKSVGTAPTVGTQMVEFHRRNVGWVAWDMSGQGRYRDLWVSHASHVHGVIFVVDVTDRARIAVAREELHGILTSRAFRKGNTPVAILANKYDAISGASAGGVKNSGRDGCLTLENVCIALAVDTLQVHRPTRAFATSALTGEGIEEAMDWLTVHATNR